MKDIILPRLFTSMRDTLLQAEWEISHSNAEDTFIVLVSPHKVIRCLLHFMPECKAVYPDGSWVLKLNTGDDTWQVETATRPINSDVSRFMQDYVRLDKIGVILKGEIERSPF